MKKVIIRRKEVQGFLPKEIRAAARVTIGSMYVGRQPLKGLDYEDSKKFLPEILGTPGDHPDFPRLEKEFWANMRVRVPFEGIELDESEMNSDMHASAEYRANLVSLYAKKAVEAC